MAFESPFNQASSVQSLSGEDEGSLSDEDVDDDSDDDVMDLIASDEEDADSN